VTLAAPGGLQSQSLATLTYWASRFVTVGLSVELPIFDASRRRATVRLQDVRAKKAALDYWRAVLVALDEVDNAITAYATDQRRHASLEQTVAHNCDAADLALQRYTSGPGNFIDVLDAERSLQQSELSLAQSSTAVSTDLIVLYRALGGDWS
jgi:multidrug efflux system outer membrane protein